MISSQLRVYLVKVSHYNLLSKQVTTSKVIKLILDNVNLALKFNRYE